MDLTKNHGNHNENKNWHKTSLYTWSATEIISHAHYEPKIHALGAIKMSRTFIGVLTHDSGSWIFDQYYE